MTMVFIKYMGYWPITAHPFLVPSGTHVRMRGGAKWAGYNGTLLINIGGGRPQLIPLFGPQEAEHGYDDTALVTMGGTQGP